MVRRMFHVLFGDWIILLVAVMGLIAGLLSLVETPSLNAATPGNGLNATASVQEQTTTLSLND